MLGFIDVVYLSPTGFECMLIWYFHDYLIVL
jgi:hypothetical protein